MVSSLASHQDGDCILAVQEAGEAEHETLGIAIEGRTHQGTTTTLRSEEV